MHEVNPYASTQQIKENRDSSWYLRRVQTYYKRMGWGMIVYIAIAIPFIIYGVMTDKRLLIGEIFGPPILAIAALTFFGMMVHTAGMLETDFDRFYMRARWLGILAGAFVFPILTIPAFVAVRRLSICRKMRNVANENATNK